MKNEISEASAKEQEFKDKHVVTKWTPQEDATEDQFTAKSIKKDKTKKASHHNGDDVEVYESFFGNDNLKEDYRNRFGDKWRSMMIGAVIREKVEGQLDELSGATLGSYTAKASKSAKDNRKAAMDHAYSASPDQESNENARAKKQAQARAADRTADKRQAGAKLAVQKLTGDKKAKVHATEAVDPATLDEAFKAGAVKLKDGSTATVTSEAADQLNALFKQLNTSNKAKMEERLMSGSKGFAEIVEFAKEV